MSLLLAPYNEAMRLGMGFNSFTQQLCINDAVKIGPHGDAATEDDLRILTRNTKPESKAHEAGQAVAPNTSEGGGKKPAPRPFVPQEVTWTAKFVDRLSEVTDSLNISGSLQIKCDLMGGANASGGFLDMNKFKESDINYFIQVRVTNQRLEVPNLTELDPSAAPSSEFTRVYGDCFISGFTTGGEFNALVSIKLKDHSTANEIRGKLEGELNLKAAKLKGEVAGEKTSSSLNIDGETTISVSWRGGGQIKADDVKDWDLNSLREIAMAFPDYIMEYPLRTNAILTKYTALKSFYAQKVRGSSLDFENASVYSSALLDAYTDYKVIWRNIHTAVWDVQEGRSMLIDALLSRKDLDELKVYYLQAKTVYDKQVAAYERNTNIHADASVDTDIEDAREPVADAAPDTDPAIVNEPQLPLGRVALLAPMPPNPLVPYKGTIIGLEKARMDCRFEMIKIVREVDAVAEDPSIASDPTRVWQYLSPPVFRTLLPIVRPPAGPEQAAKIEDEQAKAAREQAAQEQQARENLLIENRQQLEHVQAKLNLFEAAQKEAEDNLKSAKGELNLLNPYKGWCPVMPGADVRFKCYLTNKCIDYDFAQGRNLLNISPAKSDNQKWKIEMAGTISFRIQHVESKEYLVANRASDDTKVYLHLNGFGSLFTFENLNDNMVRIHLAGLPEYTLRPDEAKLEDGTTFVMQRPAPNTRPESVDVATKWYVKSFSDLP